MILITGLSYEPAVNEWFIYCFDKSTRKDIALRSNEQDCRELLETKARFEHTKSSIIERWMFGIDA